SQRAASDHGHIALPGRHRFLDGDTARPPRERPATPSVPVVVDDSLVADLFDIKPRSGRAEWPKADGDPEDPIDLRNDRDQLRGGYRRSRRSGRSRRKGGAMSRTASQTGDGRAEESSALNKAHVNIDHATHGSKWV